MSKLLSDAAKAKELIIASKPQSAVTDWIDRICHPNKVFEDNHLNAFILELIHTINLQSKGPEEASRAIRKQLKHGRIASQHKALILLGALVLNGDERFRTTFCDSKFVECIKSLINFPKTDRLVKRRTMLLLKQWNESYDSDPRLATLKNLFQSCGGIKTLQLVSTPEADHSTMIRSMITGIENSYIVKNKSSSGDIGLLGPDGHRHSKSKVKKNSYKTKEKKMKKSPIDQRFRIDDILPVGEILNLEKEVDSKMAESIKTASSRVEDLVSNLRVAVLNEVDVKSDLNIQESLGNLKVSQRTLIRYVNSAMEKDHKSKCLELLLEVSHRVSGAIKLYDSICQPTQDGHQINALMEQLGCITLDNDQRSDDLEDGQELNSGPFMSDQDFDAYQPAVAGTMIMDLIGLDFNSPNTSSKTAAATTQTNASPPSFSFSSSSPSSSSSSRFSDLNSTPLTPPKPGAISNNQSNPDRFNGFSNILSELSDFEGSLDDKDRGERMGKGKEFKSSMKSINGPKGNENNPFYKYIERNGAAHQSKQKYIDPFADP
ncbi:hypothetical protein BY996DRAFT_7617774 [Phakopsora pachyrhizi]|nr:hypothetical protein BY996DRAFT_7689815 [Phakopsora pachyrhizi]KAI8448171.1 hypothetical protein BY996DRAFT_7617774 [Phakopsora pachyrhizi]